MFLPGDENIPYVINVTREWLLKLVHCLLGYAVGMTDIYRTEWSITRKQAHRNKSEQILFPQETAKKT